MSQEAIPSQETIRPQEVIESQATIESQEGIGAPSGQASLSQARLEANRANAQNSTGPRTPEGKARVARNAIKHGLLCRQALLEFDDREEFEDLRAALWLDLKPAGAMEELLAERIIAGHWRLRRAIHLDTCLMERDVLRSAWQEDKHHLRDMRRPGQLVHPVAVGEALQKSMGAGNCAFEILRRYERTLQRDLAECLRQLERLQKTRAERASLAGPARPPVVEAGRHAAASPPAEAPSAHPGKTPGVGFVSQGARCHASPSSGEACPGQGKGHASANSAEAWHQAPCGNGFVSQRPLPDAEVGFVPQKGRSLEEELVGFVSQAMAAGK